MCVYNPEESTGEVASCTLPKLSTVYSDATFTIEELKDDLRPRAVFGTLVDNNIPFDDVLVIHPEEDEMIEEQCFIGWNYKAEHVGLLRQVKWFMKDVQDKTLFTDEVVFQGSNDNTTWTDIFTMDESIHDGWNYVTWTEPEDYPRFRFYKFTGGQTGSCRLTEIKAQGLETVDNEDESRQCTPHFVDHEGTETELANLVTFEGSLTPLLESIEPRFGGVLGGDSVTFSGTGFSDDITLYTVIIDGIECDVTAATETSVTCTTNDRPGLVESSLEIYIDGKGDVATQGKLFRYVMLWSQDVTWGGEFAPMYMESVYIPAGLNLLVDVDSTPELNAIIVEGSLIFAPDEDEDHERYFDARYLFINGGHMEVGTEEFPYTSKLTITMHGSVFDPYLPIYGNKVIAVRFGTLDLHGVERSPTWTLLDTTVEAGGSQVTLAEAVDWKVGEEVAIAATSYDPREGEKRTIASIDRTDPDKPILTFTDPLEYKHFAKIEEYGGEEIDMRAEIGLLTRNVKFRGDPETSSRDEYGANIFLHSEGDDSLMGRISYIEMTDVGQGFKIGRYAVHFHQIGAVHKSYVKGCSTH